MKIYKFDSKLYVRVSDLAIWAKSGIENLAEFEAESEVVRAENAAVIEVMQDLLYEIGYEIGEDAE